MKLITPFDPTLKSNQKARALKILPYPLPFHLMLFLGAPFSLHNTSYHLCPFRRTRHQFVVSSCWRGKRTTWSEAVKWPGSFWQLEFLYLTAQLACVFLALE